MIRGFSLLLNANARSTRMFTSFCARAEEKADLTVIPPKHN
jgi:hypothetical protein